MADERTLSKRLQDLATDLDFRGLSRDVETVTMALAVVEAANSVIGKQAAELDKLRAEAKREPFS